MRRVILIMISITLLLMPGCIRLNSDLTVDKRDYNAYVMNLQNYSFRQIPTQSGAAEMIWAPDSKHFFFIDKILKKNYVKEKIKIFSIEKLEEIKILDSINDSNTFKSGCWLNNKELAIYKHTSNYDSFQSYNIETKEIKEITKKIFQSKNTGSQNHCAHYEITEEIRNGITKQIQSNYRWGILSYDKTQFLYNTDNFKTYLYDLNTNKSRYLFDSIWFAWSSDEKKIQYSIPINSTKENFDFLGDYSSDQFETYIFDVEKKCSIKCVDFLAWPTFFSFDSKWMIFYKEDYEGKHPA